MSVNLSLFELMKTVGFPSDFSIDSRNTNYDCYFTKACFPLRVADSRSFLPSPILLLLLLFSEAQIFNCLGSS